MDKKLNPQTELSNPNDDSHGQCYAPVENGKIIEERKKHIEVGKEPPGWEEVPCEVPFSEIGV